MLCFIMKFVFVAHQKPTALPLRFLEDEGFYVGDKPNVRHSNLSVMESRLLSRSTEVRISSRAHNIMHSYAYNL